MRKSQLLLSILLFTSNLVFSQVLEWRGEGRKGIYDGTNLLTEWPAEGPELLWSEVDLPSGYSAPVIANSTIYITGLRDSVDYLVAFSLDGKIKWEQAFGGAWVNNFRGSRSTPTIDENKIYVSSGLGEVVCLDADQGQIIWKVKAHENYNGEFGRFGLAESLLVVDNKVFYTTGGDQTTMIALDKNNGALLWKSESLNDTPAYASPLLIEENGNKIICTFTKKYLFGVNPDNGEILWKFNYSEYAGKRAYNNHSCTPIYEDGGIYITSGYNHKSIKLKISEDLSEVSVDWINEVLDVHHGGVVKIGNYVYGASWDNNGNGKWACIDWTTGETKYEHAWMNKGSIIAAGDYLYCYDEKFGNVGLVKVNPTKFELISSFKVTLGKKGPYWAHPVIDKGVLYVRHEDAFMAYDISQEQEMSQWRGPNRDGKYPDKNLLKVWPENGPELVWKYDQLGLGFSCPTFTTDRFYITGTTDSIGSIFSFDLEGELQWKKEYGGEWMTNFPGSRSTPTIVGDLGYVMSGLGVVYCFNANTGENVWTVDLFKKYGGKEIRFGITEVLLVKGDILYCTAGGEDYNILALNRFTGDMEWSSKGAGKASAYTPPILFTHNGVEYLATFNTLTALAINAENGKLAWTYPMKYKGGIHGNSPIYKNGFIFVMDGWGDGSRLLKIAEDGESVQLAWENNLMDLENGDAILIGDNLFGTNWKEKGVSCVDWNTGKEKFTNKEFTSGTLAYADGLFYIYGINGKVGLIKATDSAFEVISSFQLEGKKSRDHSAHSVIFGKKLYLRFAETLWAFDIAD